MYSSHKKWQFEHCFETRMFIICARSIVRANGTLGLMTEYWDFGQKYREISYWGPTFWFFFWSVHRRGCRSVKPFQLVMVQCLHRWRWMWLIVHYGRSTSSTHLCRDGGLSYMESRSLEPIFWYLFLPLTCFKEECCLEYISWTTRPRNTESAWYYTAYILACCIQKLGHCDQYFDLTYF